MTEGAKVPAVRFDREPRIDMCEPLTVPMLGRARLLWSLNERVESGDRLSSDALAAVEVQLERFEGYAAEFKKSGGEIDVPAMVKSLVDRQRGVEGALEATQIQADLDYLRAQEERLAAWKDPRTGVYNLRGLIGQLRQLIAKPETFVKGKVETVVGRPVTIMFLDMDGLRETNTRYGHPVGDEAIDAYTKGCVDSVREADLVVRYGPGDEVVLLLLGTDVKDGLIVDTRIAAKLNEIRIATDKDDETVKVHFSTGCSQVDWSALVAAVNQCVREESDRPLTALLKEADDALFRSKRGGKGRYTVAPALIPPFV